MSVALSCRVVPCAVGSLACACGVRACVRHAVMCWCGRLGVVCLCHVYVVLYIWCYDMVMWCGSPVGFCMGNRVGYTVGLYDGLVWGCINTTTIDKE